MAPGAARPPLLFVLLLTVVSAQRKASPGTTPLAGSACALVDCAGRCAVRRGKAVCLPAEVAVPQLAKDPCTFTLCPAPGRCVVRDGKAVCIPERVQENPCDLVDCAGRCVVRRGRAVCLSPRRPGQCPDNDILPFSCRTHRTGQQLTIAKDSVQCAGDTSCPPGRKCCSYGCTQRCVAPCLPACKPPYTCSWRALGCPHSQCVGGSAAASCQLRTVPSTCSGGRCPGRTQCRLRKGRAVCQKQKPGTCPNNDIITDCALSHPCSADAECPDGERCCSRGCGLTCTPVCLHCRPPRRQCVLLMANACQKPPCPWLPVCQAVTAPCLQGTEDCGPWPIEDTRAVSTEERP